MKMPSSGSLKPDFLKTHTPPDPQTAGSSESRSAARSMTTLRRRLTLLYTVTTSLILTLVMAAFLIMRIRETKQGQMEDFYDLWNSLQFRLQSDTTISQGFLAQTEADRRVVIHIEENGTALLYNGSWQPQTPRADLIVRVKALAEAEGVFTTVRPISASSVVSSIFTFQGESGEDYCARVLVSAFGKSVRALCLIAYVPPVTDALRTTLIWLAVLEILGVAGLSAISWYFVGWSLKPVEESQRKQAEFIAAASHELRSPLAVLRSGIAALRNLAAGTAVPSCSDNLRMSGLEYSSLPDSGLSDSDLPDSDLSNSVLQNPGIPIPRDFDSAQKSAARQTPDLLSAFDSECARMARLIDDMLLLASADARTWKLQLSDVDMDTLLIDTYDAYLPLCRQKGIDLKLSLPENALPGLRGDAERIRQILAILLDNAMTYTPAGRTIQIRAESSVCNGKAHSDLHSCKDSSHSVQTEQPDRLSLSLALRMARIRLINRRKTAGCLTFHVIDEGPGIPDDIKHRIFDRFYRADSARSDKSHFGLGLSIARELVCLHGGSISVADAETGGSFFSVSLPCEILSAK